jgi:antitoxin component YwqK of YwqJK toxin-antitoxin module
MKPIKTLLTILFISLLSSPSWSVTLDDLVKRDDLYYEKFTDAPFNGKVTGKEQGSFNNGVKDGVWVSYWGNGQLFEKGNYKNGKQEGAWVRYRETGQLRSKGDFKNGKLEGAWLAYFENGQLSDKSNYKNSKLEGAWVSY